MARRRSRKKTRARERKAKALRPTDTDAVSKIVENRFVWTFFVLYGKRRVRVEEAEYRRVLAKLARAADRRLLHRPQGGARRIKHDGTTVQVKGAGHAWPLKCEALAVHPSQVAEMTAHNKRHGVNVSYDPMWGTALVPDAATYKKFRRLYRVHERNSYND